MHQPWLYWIMKLVFLLVDMKMCRNWSLWFKDWDCNISWKSERNWCANDVSLPKKIKCKSQTMCQESPRLLNRHILTLFLICIQCIRWHFIELQLYVSYVAFDYISLSFWLVTYDFCFAYGFLQFWQCFAHFWLISVSFLLLSPNRGILLMLILCISISCISYIVHLTFLILFSIVLL